MRLLLPILLSLLWGVGFSSLSLAGGRMVAPPPGGFLALCYHDTPDDVRNAPDAYALDAGRLVREFSWLHDEGYQPVSVAQLLAARDGGPPLPPKAVLLTFDDGYKTFYTHVYPLLRLFNYPAVIGLVGRWLETKEGESIEYEAEKFPRSHFMSWDEIREVASSGLVEVASHSYDLHHGILGNPQGNTQPAMVTRLYDPATKSYETESAYRQRIHDDLERNSRLLERELGKRPRVMIWPYGRYSGTVIDIAQSVGMPVTLTLDDGFNEPVSKGSSLSRLRRVILTGNPSLRDFSNDSRSERPVDARRPIRSLYVDLDQVYDPDQEKLGENLSKLIERVFYLRPRRVYLRAVADTNGDGIADASYFPNRHLPMRADLFNRVAWQLKIRGGVDLFAWMPVSAFAHASEQPLRAAEPAVQPGGKNRSDGSQKLHSLPTIIVHGTPPSGQNRHRLSPFQQPDREMIAEIYEDMAKHAFFAGILFDDADDSETDETSASMLPMFRASRHLPASVSLSEVQTNPSLASAWTQFKIHSRLEFTQYLVEHLERYRQPLMTVRTLFPQPVLEPKSQHWMMPSLSSLLPAYDQVTIRVKPDSERGEKPSAWLRKLISQTKKLAGSIPNHKIEFELQRIDRKTGKKLTDTDLAWYMKTFWLSGIRNFGYYPDNYKEDSPSANLIRPVFSLMDFPRTLTRKAFQSE